MKRPEPLFTARFFTMCGFTFTVFLSAFMLFPTAPFRVVSLGGSKLAAGLFLGLLTYASALSAPFTGALADRFGRRRMLIACGFVIAGFSAAYAVTESYAVPIAMAFFHGLFWSGLLSASAAYTTDIIPASRRAEGIGYWGLSTIAAIAVAPAAGLWLFHHGRTALCLTTLALNLLMTAIAWSLPEPANGQEAQPLFSGPLIEWRVLRLALTLFLYSFGYGGVTSFAALYAESLGIEPKGIYFVALAAMIFVVRPITAPLGDRIGHRKVVLPCLVLIAAGLALLAVAESRAGFLASAVVFGAGLGSAYPAFAAHVMKGVDPSRRGAAFGSILACFDTGVGTGSVATGWLAQRFGFGIAFGVAAGLAALALPYFLLAEGHSHEAPRTPLESP